ncbi:MAG: hypothetical protein RMJ35_12090 [Phycisphaerales bacterium]|nr:hypothetical protein [Phycisphaerales bacterium]
MPEHQMQLELNGFRVSISMLAAIDGGWMRLGLHPTDRGASFDHKGVVGELALTRAAGRIDYHLSFSAVFPTRIRLRLELKEQQDLFHLICGNIHGDNNAPHVRAGEFPVLAPDRLTEVNRARLWEFRADRSSHPVSILCCRTGAVGISIDPYSDCSQAPDGFIRNGVFAALPDAFGVSLGYGNDPLTFQEKTLFKPATSNLSHRAKAAGSIFAYRGGRRAAFQIVRELHARLRELPTHRHSPRQALRALAEAFIQVNFSPELDQYTNRKCLRPIDLELRPWRAIVEIGWTGGSMMAYPFALLEAMMPDLRFPKGPATIFDQICTGFQENSGLINDTCLNRFTRSIPPGWNQSDINGWWSGERVPLTRDNHCAYTNAHAAYYLLAACELSNGAVAQAGSSVLSLPRSRRQEDTWRQTALRVLDTAIALQRSDGAFGYIFSGKRKEVLDYEGFAGCWFAAALARAWKLTARPEYRTALDRALDFYAPFVAALAAWGTPMDTCKSVDSEGNLAFIRATRLMHEYTGEQRYLDMLLDGANYEYLWRYAFRARPQAPPLKGSAWNSCGGSLTSVSNPHIHPMSVVVTEDLEYLARQSGDSYHQQRADEGLAWLLNTMELYPEVTGYGRYGVLSERMCPSDGLLSERFYDDDSPSSTWWSYNAWAAASAMEGLATWLISRGRGHPEG